jgi:ELWxxDGT repeat protein
MIAKTDGYSFSEQNRIGVRLPQNDGPLSAIVGGIMYFAATGGGLWRTDGTIAGTSRITRLSPFNLRAADSKLLFSAFAPTINSPLWVSDGTTAGTMTVKRPSESSIGNEEISDLTELDGIFYFLQLNTLRHLDSSLTRLSNALDPEQIDFPKNLINVGGTLFFTSSGPFAHPRGGLYRFVPDE